MIKLDLHYVDPRLVELYDLDNPRGKDTLFYASLADDLNAQIIIDLGCGTGLLTRELAKPGRVLIGVDPAPAMLDFARRQPGADRVTWVKGDSSALGQPQANLAIMTGNVAQVFLEDADWSKTLNDLYAALRPGGFLAFESRNPADRAWERWTKAETFERINYPGGPMECWLEPISAENGRARFSAHNVFLNTGELLVAESELRFRSREEITHSLEEAGFTVEQLYGDWQRGLLTDSSRVMIFVARRA